MMAIYHTLTHPPPSHDHCFTLIPCQSPHPWPLCRYALQMTDTDTFKLVSKLLSQEVSHISAAGGGNSAELTQNVLLLRDSRHIEVCVIQSG